MKSGAGYLIVLVTAPDLKVARLLSRSVLKQNLAACANIVPKLESHYWWRGKLEKSAEALILFKTSKRQLNNLETLILAEHPYDTPEIISIRLDQGTERYLDWLRQNTSQKL
jgi:periplasmic divalent cation tolerance protein